MSLNPVLKASGSVGLNTGGAAVNNDLPSITFTAGRRIVVFAQGTFTSDSASGVMTCTAPSHTFATIVTAYQSSANKAGGEVLSAIAAGGPTVLHLSSSGFGTYGAFYSVYECSEFDEYTPFGARAALADDSGDGAKTITLDAAPLDTSIVLAGAMMDTDPGTQTVTKGTDWTQDALVGSTAPDFGKAHYQRRAGSTSTSVTWDDLKPSGAAFTASFVGLAVEVRESGASGGTGTFAPGRMRDDGNGVDTVDIGANGWTELEWSLQTTGETESYEFQVRAGSTPLDTYTVTPQLTTTPPAGSYAPGRMWDDENGVDEVNIGVNGYTELEWSLQLAPSAGDSFEFRVQAGATPLDVYAAVPQLELLSDHPTGIHADALYVGTQAVDKIYAGATRVW